MIRKSVLRSQANTGIKPQRCSGDRADRCSSTLIFVGSRLVSQSNRHSVYLQPGVEVVDASLRITEANYGNYELRCIRGTR